MYFQPYGDEQQLNLNWIINEIITLRKQLNPNYEAPSFDSVYPYSNLSQLNLDWILSELKILKENAVETKAGDAVLNIANAINEPLTSDNIVTAIENALEKTSYIYIPKGDFSLHYEIEKDCTIILDSECHLTPADDRTIFFAKNCSFNLTGGTITCGENDNSRISTNNYLIYLQNCHDCSISNIYSPYSKTRGLIWIDDCENVIIEKSRFINLLRAAVFIADHSKNITVQNNYFDTVQPIENQDYCYFVYTGVTSNSERIEPCENIIYQNNFCINSDDCALDSHGAKNITIRNNTILNTVNAITAYNDNNRALRPQGWKMCNVLIENNYCYSDKTIPSGSAYPHPFIFLGAALTTKKSVNPDNYGTFNDFVDCRVINNFIHTANNYTDGAIYLSQVSKNVLFENNTIELTAAARARLYFRRSFNFAFRNNAVIGEPLTLYPVQGTGVFSGNTGVKYDYANTAVCYFNGMDITQGYAASPTLKTGDVFWVSTLRRCTSYGLRARYSYPEEVKTFAITVVNGVATTANNLYIPDLALSLTGDATVNAYITDVIDFESFTIRNASGNPVPDGSYTATIRDFTYVEV